MKACYSPFLAHKCSRFVLGVLRGLVGLFLFARVAADTAEASGNLLVNGDFSSSLNATWMVSPTNGGSATIDSTAASEYDGTPFLSLSSSGGTSGVGVVQFVQGVPNATYTLSCVSSVQNRLWPHGFMVLAFMDASLKDLQVTSIDCAAGVTSNDMGLSWSNYTLTAISPPGTTAVRVQFNCNGNGNVRFDNVVLTSFTPAIIAAVQGTNAISLTWSRSPTALSYNVKRSPTHGGPYVTIAAGVNATNYTDSAAAIGATCYYVVSEVNASGEGSNSGEASALPGNFLKTSGFDVRDHGGKGGIVSLRGVNLGGWLYIEGWMCPAFYGQQLCQEDVLTNLISRFGVATTDALLDVYQSAWITSADLDLVASAGMNLVRCPIHWSLFQEQAVEPSVALTNVPWKSDAVAFKHLDWLVSECARRNLYVLFDFHHPEGMNGTNTDLYHNNNLYNEPGYSARLVEIWRRMAAHYAGNPTVWGYDLVNESIGGPNVNNVWNCAYQAIRSVDPDHCVIAETYSISGCQSLMSSYGWQNVVASTHDYWSDGTTVFNELSPARAAGGAIVCPYYVGEFMESTNGSPRIGKYCDSGALWSSWTVKTVGQMSWSMLNASDNGASSSTDIPDLNADSADVISAKWAKWQTKSPTVRYQPTSDRLASPIAVNDSFPVAANGSLDFTAQMLLANDTDINQLSQLDVTNIPLRTAHGLITTTTNGYHYQANSGFSGVDTFTYKALDRRLHLPSANIATVTLCVQVPQSIGGLTALGGNQQVSLSWSPVAGAGGYNVKRAGVSGGPYTTISSVAAPNFVDASAPVGVSSYYVVSPTNGYGEGAVSAEASAAPVDQISYAVADAYVRGGSYAGNNFGTSQTIDLKEDPNSSYLRRGYLRFDVRGLTNALKVVLSLMPVAVATPVPALSIAVVTNDVWTESGITWNNQPAETGVTAATLTNLVVNTPVLADLTAAAQAAAASDGWLSLRLMLNAAVNVSFGAREQPAITNQPQLLITWPAPMMLDFQRIGNTVQIAWPQVYPTPPHLLVQTNPAGGGLGTNWMDYGAVPNPVVIPDVGNNGSAFYRIRNR